MKMYVKMPILFFAALLIGGSTNLQGWFQSATAEAAIIDFELAEAPAAAQENHPAVNTTDRTEADNSNSSSATAAHEASAQSPALKSQAQASQAAANGLNPIDSSSDDRGRISQSGPMTSPTEQSKSSSAAQATNANTSSMIAEIVSIDTERKQLTVRDSTTGSLRTVTVSDMASLKNVHEGDQVRITLSPVTGSQNSATQ